MKKIAIILMICFCGTAWAIKGYSFVTNTLEINPNDHDILIMEYNDIDDIKKALELAIEHIERMRPQNLLSSESTTLEYILDHRPPPTPAEIKRQEAKDLMEEADQIEQCEKDLEFIKSVLQGL